MTSRAEFIERVRARVAGTPGLFRASTAARPADPAAAAAIITREMSERWPGALERFVMEFERVGGVFHRVPLADAVAATVVAICRERGAAQVVAWHAAALGCDLAALTTAGLALEEMPRLAIDEAARAPLRSRIAEAQVGVTGADLVIAETGSLLLRSGAGRPRSTSLLPPYHVAVFDRHALVESLQQAGVFLEAWHGAGEPPGPGGAINIITGPSRTADIELTLTRGVHGPKEVHAIFVESGLRPPSPARG